MSVRPSSKATAAASALAGLAVVLATSWLLRPRVPGVREKSEEVAAPVAAEPSHEKTAPARAAEAALREVDPMERLRALVDADPAAALALARADERAPSADERSFLAMRALVHLGRIAAARDEAAEFFQKYPESSWAERVERLTGVHPRRYYQNFR